MTKLNDGFDQPQEISDALFVFPGDVRSLMPKLSEIPEDFVRGHSEWNRFVSHWFFRGDPFAVWDLHTNPEVDPNLAFRHLSTIMKSFQPKHEHKEAAVAYLASRWFSKIEKKEL